MNKKAMTVRGPDSDDSPADAHLWVCSGKNVGRRYAITTIPKVLGRAVACDIVVEDERASQRHARIQFLQGRHTLEDLGSTNGTFVNSNRVQRAELQDGDLVQIGETVFEYISEGAAAEVRDSDTVPSTLRSGAQQVLRTARRQPGGEMVPAAGPRAPELNAPGYPAGYPPMAQSPYPGHYPGHYYEEEADEEPAFDLIATLIRVRKIVAAYIPYWPIAASFVFIGVALGALYHKYSPVPYSAEFQIVLRPVGTSGTVLGGVNGSDGNIEFFGNQVATRFTSAPVIEHALKRVSGQSPSAVAVAVTGANLTFKRLGNFQSHMYSGGIIASDGDYAVRYLNTHLRVFLDREVEMALSQVKADVGFFRKEVDKTARLLDQAESAVSQYKATHPDALPEQARSNYNLLFTLQQRRSELERSLVALEASLREDNRQFAQTQKYTKSSVSQKNTFLEKISIAETKIAEARAQGKGDLHPDILRLKKELAEYQQLSIAQDGNSAGDQTQFTLNPTYQRLQQRVQEGKARSRALKQELKQVDADLETQKKKIGSLPQAEAEYQDLARQYETTQKEYSALLNRLKNAELHLDRERARADSQYNIVVPPRQITRDPNQGRFLRLLIGGFLGMFIALGLSTILAFRSGALSLSLLIGREIDLSALFGDEESSSIAPSPRPGRALDAASPAVQEDMQALSAPDAPSHPSADSVDENEDETLLPTSNKSN